MSLESVGVRPTRVERDSEAIGCGTSPRIRVGPTRQTSPLYGRGEFISPGHGKT